MNQPNRYRARCASVAGDTALTGAQVDEISDELRPTCWRSLADPRSQVGHGDAGPTRSIIPVAGADTLQHRVRRGPTLGIPRAPPGSAKYVPSMYQHNGKQRYTEGNSGQHEMRSDQVKSLLPGTQHSFAHSPRVAGSNPAPATRWKCPETLSFRAFLVFGRSGRLPGSSTGPVDAVDAGWRLDGR